MEAILDLNTRTRGGPKPSPAPCLEVNRDTAVDEPTVEAEWREDRIRDVDLVRRIDAADRRRPGPEGRTVGIDVEQIVRTERELDRAAMRPHFEVGNPFCA